MDLAIAMALVRSLHLAATLSLLGTAGFIAWVLPAASAVPRIVRRNLRRLWWISGILALLAGAGWFVIQSATIAGAVTMADVLDALPVVAGHTRYGTILMSRFGLLAIATTGCLLIARRWAVYLTLALVVIAVGLEGMIGHAGATAGAIGDGLVLSEALHLTAAGVWLGSLLPLWLSLRGLAPAEAATVCERFSPIGLACVLVLAGTGFVQGQQLIGSVPALFGTSYGHFAVLKIGLFVLGLILAALNRLWLTDRLGMGAARARGHLLLSVGVETLIGLAIVTAAAFMASSPPAAHTEPVWPFPWQFSLTTVNEDPDFRREVAFSLITIGGAVALMVAALLVRRLRLLALALLIGAVVLRGPSLSLLTVEAFPTSFQTSPTGFAAASIIQGQAVFARQCVVCHGAGGDGDGPAAAGLRIKPADLTAPHIWGHTDGELFWWITHGVDDPEGGLAMQGFGQVLSEDDRWAVIDYVKAHNAGVAFQQDQEVELPVRAPAIAIRCDGPSATRIADLQGHAIHLVSGPTAEADIPPQGDISTVTLDLRDTAKPPPNGCAAADPSAWNAYAVLADVAPADLPGTEFLVDPNGWLRAVHRPESAGGWHTKEDLLAAIRGICTHPIQQASGGLHDHHH